jgi:hypothetical protein
MSLMIGAVVIVIIVAGAAFFMSGKSGAKNTAQSETQEKKGSEGKETAVVQEKAESADKSQSAEAREKKAKTESVLENDKEKGTGENTEKIISENQKVKNEEKVDFKEKNRQKEQLYYYINHELQTLFAAYNKGEWNQLEKLGDMSSTLYKEKESIIEGLPSFTGTMVKEYFSCIDFKKEEEKAVCYVKDKEQLKKAFLQFMMPFYPYYYKQLSEGGLRHTALLQPNTLRLFQQLTGKKFRPGYRNRYTTGVRAFEWDKNRYKVYGKDGKLLCDAIFGTDGIIEGYGQKKYTDETHPDWNIVEEGNWENGTFEGGILRYEYKRPVE